MISLVRVDDRLIHGQVQTNWIQIARARSILIIDDNVRNDEIACQVLRFALPATLKMKILNVEEACAFWTKAVQSPNKILVLFKTINSCAKMQKKGVLFKSILIGPVCNKVGAKEIVSGTYFTEEEIQDAKNLSEKGVEIFFQQTPDIKKEKWKDINK